MQLKHQQIKWGNTCHNEHNCRKCHDPQCTRACQTYFPWPWTRCIDPRSILAEQCTMPDEATKVGMQNTDAHVCVPLHLVHKLVYISNQYWHTDMSICVLHPNFGCLMSVCHYI